MNYGVREKLIINKNKFIEDQAILMCLKIKYYFSIGLDLMYTY